jgi:hypothetical protein
MSASRLSAGLIVGALLMRDADAAKCIPMSQARHYHRADIVIVGLVEKLEPVDSRSGASVADVAVERQWKGVRLVHVSVLTDDVPAVGFIAGKRYLIYLKSASAQAYVTDSCSGTAPVDHSQRALRWLDEHAVNDVRG